MGENASERWLPPQPDAANLLQSWTSKTAVSEPTPNPQARDADLEPGERVGEYIVDSKLGEGAFGTVFRGTHPVIGKVVAIKVLARKFSVDPEMVSRFVAEAKAVNQIRHRNIIDIFSFASLPDDRHYYVMEYLDGETLDAHIARDGKLSLAEALPILRGIARALDAAHAMGIAHRDLKAENVFLATDSAGVFPKLLDFGIAKLLAPEDNALEHGVKHKTRTGTPVGTPYYMSPEQCRGRDVDHRTDFYAFGVLAYLLLTGKYPHDADDYLSILMRQLTEHPQPPTAVAPELPRGIDDAIGWLIAKDPADRPPTLREAMTVFEQAAADAGIVVVSDPWDASLPGTETRPPNTSPARASGIKSKPPSWGQQRAATAPTAETAMRKPGKRTLASIAGLVLIAAAVIALLIVRPWDSAIESTPAPEPRPNKIVVEPAKAADVPSLEAQTVIVNVTGVPDGTEVLVGGMTVGAVPGPVQLPRDASQLVLVFKADGYKLESRTLTPDRDQAITVKLKKKLMAAPVKKPTRDDIIDDPFKKNP